MKQDQLQYSENSAVIVPTQARHHHGIETLLDESFGDDRLSRTSYAVRLGSDAISELSFVITYDDIVIASIACWQICLKDGDNIISLTMVGPIAVSASHQNLGLGRQLVSKVIETAAKIHDVTHDILMMIGDPEYYGQFGFAAWTGANWTLPGPYEKHRLLLRGDISALPKNGILGPYPSEFQ